MTNMEFMQEAIVSIIVVAVVLLVLIYLFRLLRDAINNKRPAKPSSYVQMNTAERKATAKAYVPTEYRTVQGFPVKLDTEKQTRHMPGRSAYEIARTSGNLRSVIFRDANALQKLLDEKAGSGEFIGINKEKVDFGQTIGQYVDVDGRSKRETKIGIIHYSAEGAYIVPARPNEGGA